MPDEPALFPFGETAYGNGNGDQHDTFSLHATDLLVMNVNPKKHWASFGKAGKTGGGGGACKGQTLWWSTIMLKQILNFQRIEPK